MLVGMKLHVHTHHTQRLLGFNFLHKKAVMQKGFGRRLYKKLKIIFWNKLHILVRLRKFLLRSSISVQTLALDLTICESDKRKHIF